MKNLYLCGFMGAGKTTVAKALSKRLELPCYDTDDLIVLQAGMPIPAIFSKEGEEGFRQWETACLRQLGGQSGAVIATGGGLVMNPKNVEIMKNQGILVFLDAPFELCYLRIHGDKNRPNAASRTKEELYALYRERKTVYRKASDAVIACRNRLAPVLNQLEQLYKENE